MLGFWMFWFILSSMWFFFFLADFDFDECSFIYDPTAFMANTARIGILGKQSSDWHHKHYNIEQTLMKVNYTSKVIVVT